jgi:hypothetical protein
VWRGGKGGGGSLSGCGSVLLTASQPQLREFKKMILLGYKFAQRLDEAGEFDRFDCSGAAK